MAENTREIALDTLLTLERGEEFSHKLIRAVLDKYNYLEEREKAFIKRVTEGTIERRIELDYYLDACSTVPVRKMKPLIRCLMRMSVYQLLYMDAVPDSAVCNEACKLAQKRGFGGLKGFVNGVLRGIARQKGKLPLPDAEKETEQYLSVKYSMPVWLVQMWRNAYGAETTEKILGGLLEIHPVSLRFRTDMTESEKNEALQAVLESGAHLKQSELLPYLYTVDNTENLAELPGFAVGAFAVQDVSSALAVEAAGIKPGDFVMDICAAPGGKSMLAAEKAAERAVAKAAEKVAERAVAKAAENGTEGTAGRVLAWDVSEAKIALVEENAARMRIGNIVAEIHDATRTEESLLEKADVVLADVPCSGLGVVGKKRDIKYRATPEGLSSLQELQRKILENSWRYVKPGGVLLYSTCTINPAENEEMVAWICENFPFDLEEQKQFFPGIDAADGFFYARLRRKV